MRLINANTLKFEEFYHDIPPYAILSHTWGSDEVTFEMYQEYLNVTNHCLCPGTNARTSNIEKKAGFAKIMGACKRAREDKLGYLWCDTNCIDKSSSAELTEAINSMYAWYRDSAVCYAYLADVDVVDIMGKGADEFGRSRWFTRGWTLQELLAPEKVLFFNRNWKFIVNRQHSAGVIHAVTRIHTSALNDRNKIRYYSIAQRMSWAAHRQTSRQEDIAYCLLGIFEINMPLLYGEGIEAFIRLQKEVIKASNDHSIFSWDSINDKTLEYSSLLASSPRSFASCGSVVMNKSVARRPYSITNLGVSLQLPMIRTLISGIVLVGLNCAVELHRFRPREASPSGKVRFPVWIWLKYTGENNIYGRLRSGMQSRTSLPVFYPAIAKCVEINLFGIINQRQLPWLTPQLLPDSSSAHSVSAPAGFHVVIGFGRIRPGTTVLEDAFPPRHYVMFQLSPRGSPALSHEIIVVENHVVLLSIVWDHRQQPKHWCHENFLGGLSTVGHWSMNNWDILFRTRPESDPGKSDPVRRIEYVYDQLRKYVFYQSTSESERNVAPFVDFEKDVWQDHHGKATVVSHVTFREMGKR